MRKNGIGRVIGLVTVLLIVGELLIPDKWMYGAFITLALFLAIGMVLVIYGTITRNRWGINTDPIQCPVCGQRAPTIRRPKSFREMLWGGGTCEKCGCEMDKWGNRITA